MLCLARILALRGTCPGISCSNIHSPWRALMGKMWPQALGASWRLVWRMLELRFDFNNFMCSHVEFPFCLPLLFARILRRINGMSKLLPTTSRLAATCCHLFVPLDRNNRKRPLSPWGQKDIVRKPFKIPCNSQRKLRHQKISRRRIHGGMVCARSPLKRPNPWLVVRPWIRCSGPRLLTPVVAWQHGPVPHCNTNSLHRSEFLWRSSGFAGGGGCFARLEDAVPEENWYVRCKLGSCRFLSDMTGVYLMFRFGAMGQLVGIASTHGMAHLHLWSYAAGFAPRYGPSFRPIQQGYRQGHKSEAEQGLSHLSFQPLSAFVAHFCWINTQQFAWAHCFRLKYATRWWS